MFKKLTFWSFLFLVLLSVAHCSQKQGSTGADASDSPSPADDSDSTGGADATDPSDPAPADPTPSDPDPTDPTDPTPPETPEVIVFAALGDTGTGDANQQKVADAMAAKCAVDGCQFILLLGDNFYETGVSDVADPLFQTAFETPYAAINVDFFPVFGNHDYLGNIQAQIDYSSISTKWNFPARYYSHEYPSTNPYAEFYALDANNFDAAHASWLDSEINASTHTWHIAYDHQPLFSNGPHGDDELGIGADLVPILCNKTDLIISGHDHDKEHLIGERDGCLFHQVVLGSGGRSLYAVAPDIRTLFAVSSYGFGWFEVSESEIFFQFIDADGVVEYEYHLVK